MKYSVDIPFPSPYEDLYRGYVEGKIPDEVFARVVEQAEDLFIIGGKAVYVPPPEMEGIRAKLAAIELNIFETSLGIASSEASRFYPAWRRRIPALPEIYTPLAALKITAYLKGLPVSERENFTDIPLPDITKEYLRSGKIPDIQYKKSYIRALIPGMAAGSPLPGQAQKELSSMKNMACWSCVIKHICGAISFAQEVMSGHGMDAELNHIPDMLGDIIQAERHLAALSEKNVAEKIYAVRQRLENSEYAVGEDTVAALRVIFKEVFGLKKERSGEVYTTNIKGASKMPLQPPLYDLRHWGETPPKVSCICVTYGRTTLLDEAVQSFLSQDYTGWKEMVIVNDYDKLELACGVPGVRVINIKERFGSLGEKRNYANSMAEGEVLFVWDDDDISLPNRISYTLQQMKHKYYYRPNQVWRIDGKLLPDPSNQSVYAAMSYTKDAFKAVGGYRKISYGEDVALDNAFHAGNSAWMDTEDIIRQNCFYIYRWTGPGRHHISADWALGEAAYDTYKKAVETNGTPSKYTITPSWKADYVGMVDSHVHRVEAVPAGPRQGCRTCGGRIRAAMAVKVKTIVMPREGDVL